MATGLSEHKDRFFARYPEARKLAGALKSPRNPEPLFFFYQSTHRDLNGQWLVLGRLGPELEASLSVHGEVLFVFSPFEDFQRRSYNAIVTAARDEIAAHQQRIFNKVRFSPDQRIILVHSKDGAAATNVAAWNGEGARSLVAVLPQLDQTAPYSRDGVASAVARVLASRDLYRGRNPVTGNDFFGRNELIQQLTAELRSGRSLGLFGLRRSGKTSVLREMRRRSEASGVVFVLSDLEAVDDLEGMVPQLAFDLVNGLRRVADYGHDVYIGSEREQAVGSFSELSTRLVRVAEKNRELFFVIALDEIESLRRLSSISADAARSLLGALRRASQATENLSLLFTGVTTEFFDRSMLPGDVDNPLFGFVDPHFLRPFERQESATLVRELGALMMLDWQDEALDLIHNFAGGFPFLVRDLASRVRSAARATAQVAEHEIVTPLAVTSEHVLAARVSWTESASELWKEIVRTLEFYHPVMAELVRCDSNDELNEWVHTGSEAEVAAGNLLKLGLLERTEVGDFERATVLLTLQGLAAEGSQAVAQLRARRAAAARVDVLKQQPESSKLEFKSTCRVNLHTLKRDDQIEMAVVKTVAAFMNSEGGTLLIGVDDDGEVRGIAEDLALCRNSADQFERWLCGDLLSGRIGADLVASYVSFQLIQFGSAMIVEVDVKPTETVAWVEDGKEGEKVFVRNGNETRQLTGKSMVEYVQRRSSM